MIQGIFLVIAACFLWGWIYVVPQYMSSFSSLEVALGRYFFYGAISVLFMVCFRMKQLLAVPKNLWKMAFLFGLLTNIAFYPLAVLCMRCADSTIAALILGMSPVTIAFYGNWKEKECSFKSLMWPSIAMMTGLILVNIMPMQESFQEGSLGVHCLGLLFGFLSLASWSLYAVINGHLLRHNTTINSLDWCSIVGIATFVWVLAIIAGMAVFLPDHHLQKYVVYTPELAHFLIGSAILGVMCSWMGFYLWNKGSCVLPVSQAGQLTIFETLFGLLFIYIINQRMPSLLEFCGISCMAGGIIIGVRNFAEKPMQNVQPATENNS